MHPPAPAPSTPWRDRLRALRNIPPLAAMVWQTSPALAAASLGLRLLASCQPVAMLWVAKLIIDRVVAAVVARTGTPADLWPLVALELALAVSGDLLLRAINLSESLLGDRFSNHVSLRLMRHAGRLDLAHFEDPVFYDKLERARKQTTSRLSMLTQLAGLAQGTSFWRRRCCPSFGAKRALRCWPIRSSTAGRPSGGNSTICGCWVLR